MKTNVTSVRDKGKLATPGCVAYPNTWRKFYISVRVSEDEDGIASHPRPWTLNFTCTKRPETAGEESLIRDRSQL